MAYFCDLTIASEQAIFGQNGPRVGSPACGAIVSYLTRVVGAKKAREIWMLCRRYTAKEALEMGIVNTVVLHAQLDEEVDKWCKEILALSPTCMKILKASFVEEYNALLGQGDELRRYMVTPEFWKYEQQEGAAAFLEKRAPDFWLRAQRASEPDGAYLACGNAQKRWCPGRESNPHAFRPRILSPVRLPISPPGRPGTDGNACTVVLSA